MHDIKQIRADAAAFDAAMARRGLPPIADAILALDAERRAAQTALQEKQSRRNALAREVGQGKRQGTDTAALEAEATALRADMEALEAKAAALEAEAHATLARLPNVMDAAVPDGAAETNNLEMKRWGMPRDMGFTPKQHFELGEQLGMMDFEVAAKLAGARFTVLRGGLARLERALGQFMLDIHTQEHGYIEHSVPSLVNDAAVFGTNQLPKFAEDLFRTTDGRWLIPTAEVPLTNTVAGEILAESSLPRRLTALTDCFRSEAGASGRDTRGMLRQHQFRKVELVSITRPDASDAEHERMTSCAEHVLELLELPYRRMKLCTGDTGAAAAITFDLEVWLPGQGMWREISSCSNTRAFQARRMNARFRGGADGKTVGFVNTLNGSGVAVGRALIAVMENWQTADGAITIPPALRPYMSGATQIGK
jgi:seryl-tRNA synthetase